MSDQQAVKQLTTGFNKAKHAKDLALTVIGGPPAKEIAATRRKKAKTV